MTLLRPQSSAKRPHRPAPTRLPKPVTADDVADLLELAERLGGRPVPGVRMTEKEFEAWCDPEVKAEWVDGEVVLMSPESLSQITLATWLVRLLTEFVERHDLGEVIGRDFLVRLPNQRRWRAPDLLFVARDRAERIQETFLDGAPDLAIEIVSPDSQTRDRRDKYREYERAGVREYWILDPVGRHVEAYALGKNKRFRQIEEADGKLPSSVLPGFYLRPDWLRRAKLPPVAKILRELGVRR